MSGRREYRLGIGDGVPQGQLNTAAAWRFLEAVRKHVPDAMAALRAIACDRGTDDEAIRQWCAMYGFQATTQPDWLTDVAFDTAGWLGTKQPDWPELWSFTPTQIEPVFPQLSTTWDPIEETLENFRARVEHYIESVKATPGWESTPKKRIESGDDPGRHFVWTALYQVARLEYSDIAERENLRPGGLFEDPEEAIRKAISVTADLIGLRVRESTRPIGRPPSRTIRSQTHRT